MKKRNLTEQDKRILNQILNDSEQVLRDAINFYLNDRSALLRIYIQFLITLSSISIAILGLGFSTDVLQLDILSGSALFFALILIILSVTYARELIDINSKDLERSIGAVIKTNDELTNKIREAVKYGDYDIVKNYIRAHTTNVANGKNTKLTLDYFGELAVFLFITPMSLTVASLVIQNLDEVVCSVSCKIITVVGIIFIASLISFLDWSKLFINKISGILHKILRKNIN